MNLRLLAIPVAMTMLSAGAQQVESRAYYSTNADDAVGKAGTITIDGEFTDWSEDMIIATCGANDMCTAFKGSHENGVIDMYALYAAWDDSNLYLAWQMCNTGDTWARPGDGPLTDYGRIGNKPMVVALSLDPSAVGMTGLLTSGKSIWMDNSPGGLKFTTHVDRLLYFSGEVGQGEPAMFRAVDGKGNTNYTAGVGHESFAKLGIKYAMKEGFHPSHLWRQKTTAQWADPTTLLSDPEIYQNIFLKESYDDLKAGTPSGLKQHDYKYDSFYEMMIPFKALGITREWLEKNGLGVRVIGTRGESAIDCIPFDMTVVDNIFGEYGADNSTSHEKDDWDDFTYALASVGHLRDIEHVDPLPDPQPRPDDPDDPDNEDEVYFTTKAYNAYLDAEAAGWETAFAYVWDAGNSNKQYAGGWPGTQMARVKFDGKSYFKYSFDADNLSKPMIIFNPGGDNGKTADLEFHNNGIYTLSGYAGSDINPSDVPVKPNDAISTVGVDSSITVNGLTVGANGRVEIYNMTGALVAAGFNSATAPVAGLYVVRTAAGAAKVALR